MTVQSQQERQRTFFMLYVLYAGILKQTEHTGFPSDTLARAIDVEYNKRVAYCHRELCCTSAGTVVVIGILHRNMTTLKFASFPDGICPYPIVIIRGQWPINPSSLTSSVYN